MSVKKVGRVYGGGDRPEVLKKPNFSCEMPDPGEASQVLHSPFSLAMTIKHGRISCSILPMRQTIKPLNGMVVLLMIIILHSQICKAQPSFTCHHNVNYTKGSEFERNLNTVMSTLIKDSSKTGFHTSENGQSSDQIYGLLQCRADTTGDQCHDCSQQANNTLRQNCGNAGGGLIWFNFCFLRYENYNFIGQLDTAADGWTLEHKPNIALNVEAFNKAVGNLFYKLLDEATAGSKLYAAENAKDSLSRDIYGLVQCTGDIAVDNCTACLTEAINTMLGKYNGSRGYEGLYANCRVRYDIYSFLNSISSPPPAEMQANKPDAQSLLSPMPGRKFSTIVIIIFAGLMVLLAAVFVCVLSVCVLRTRRRSNNSSEGRAAGMKAVPNEAGNRPEREVSLGRQLRRGISDHGQVEEDKLTAFTIQTLREATGNFHENNELGKGGFGAVYKGTTADGNEIAVKKLFKKPESEEQFLNEVKLMGKCRHRNIAKLVGYCTDEEGSERLYLLVYEYLPNCLDKILFDSRKVKQLDWQKREDIIVGAASGLHYLHEGCRESIIHCDIKASNILLDENLHAKIADFGFARLFPDNQTHLSISRLVGTFGYMAPEYALQRLLSVKADVYSFGVLLLELITGKNNFAYIQQEAGRMLSGRAWSLYQKGNVVDMIDPTIIERCDKKKVSRWIQVGLLCTQEEPKRRPSMSEIISMLSNDGITLQTPKKPPLVSSDVLSTDPPQAYASIPRHNYRPFSSI